MVARWIRDRAVPGSNPVYWTLVSLRNSCELAIYTVALGRLSLAVHLQVGKNEQQLCAAPTTDTFRRFTSPEPKNSQRKLVSG